MKTNKSYTKRLRVTKNGKIVARRAGQNHFNAKESGRGRQNRRKAMPILMSAKDRQRFLPGMGA
jgi:ribosomal protein L35